MINYFISIVKEILRSVRFILFSCEENKKILHLIRKKHEINYVDYSDLEVIHRNILLNLNR